MYSLILFIAAVSAVSFEDWKNHFGATYESTSEETARRAVWEFNLKRFGKNALNPYSDVFDMEMPPLSETILGKKHDDPDHMLYPFKRFSPEFVEHALEMGMDWREHGAVSQPKSQSKGFCGSFSRVSASESQRYLWSNYALRNFSVEQLIDCDPNHGSANQVDTFFNVGFMSMEDYPTNHSHNWHNNHGLGPFPPCKLDKTKIIHNTTFTNQTETPRGSEDAEELMAAFLWKNGPVQAGILADVFHNAGDDHFVSRETCRNVTSDKHGNPINHSINIVGFGTNKKWGDYWIIKNSWGTWWQDGGFIYMPRGIRCGNIHRHGARLYTYGHPYKYYCETCLPHRHPAHHHNKNMNLPAERKSKL